MGAFNCDEKATERFTRLKAGEDVPGYRITTAVIDGQEYEALERCYEGAVVVALNHLVAAGASQMAGDRSYADYHLTMGLSMLQAEDVQLTEAEVKAVATLTQAIRGPDGTR